MAGRLAIRAEGLVARRFRNEIIEFRHPVQGGGLVGEIDVGLPNAIIEVSRSGGRKATQLLDLQSVALNPTGRPVYLIITEGATFNRIRDIQRATSVRIVTSLDELERLIRGSQ